MFFSKLPTQLIVILGGFSIQVTRKDIRTIRLAIRRTTGEIRLSVPKRFSDSEIQEFLKERISWIEAHIQRNSQTPPVSPLDISQISIYRSKFE
jgi:predicted metal-dependent hydrolase